MSSSGGNPDFFRSPTGSTIGGNGASSGSRRYGLPFLASNLIQATLSSLLEYSGIFRPRSSHLESESLSGRGVIAGTGERATGQVDESFVADSSGGEVSIRIFDIGDQENPRASSSIQQPLPVGLIREGSVGDHGVSIEQMQMVSERHSGEGVSSNAGVGFSSVAEVMLSPSVSGIGAQSVEGEGNVAGGNVRDSAYQRYDIQQAARWIEQVLPFSLLLLVVFIRQHLRGFFITIWLSAVMFKSNDLMRKQTALKGERKFSVLVGIAVIFTVHVVGVYWWYNNDELLYSLVMLPPKEVPLFWHAIFIIMVNDTMVRQTSMAVKCVLLVYYKNSRGCNYRKQVCDLFAVTIMMDLIKYNYSSSDSTDDFMDELDKYIGGHLTSENVDGMPLLIGTQFDDSASFRQFIRSKAIVENFGVKIKASDRKRVIATCSYSGCPWRVRASVGVDGQTFEVTKIESSHSCPGINRAGNREATSSLVAREIEDVKKYPDIPPKQINNGLETKYGLSLPYMRLWRSRQLARDNIFGSVDDSYKWVLALRSELVTRNPGSHITFEYNDTDHSFERFYVSFRVCIDGFLAGCRHLVRLDACH